MLIVTTTWWAFAARIAMEFQEVGIQVAAICPKYHPLRALRTVGPIFRYAALRPLRALEEAVLAFRPDLLVPCDDRAVGHLHRLHAATSSDMVRHVIVRSLGDAGSFPTVLNRARFIALARRAGVRAPEMIPLRDEADLAPALSRVGLPAVLKVDGTWGGLGTHIVATLDEAITAWRQATRPLSGARALKRWLVDRDPYHLLPWAERRRPIASLQRLAPGAPANCVVAAWEGEVLALTSVEVLASNGALGAATIVHVLGNAEIAQAAHRLVRELRLSGFCGFDFTLDADTGIAHLLEINPRATPLCHLALGPGREPVAALAARVSRIGPPAAAPVTDNDVIAYFPQAWLQDPANVLLPLAYHDVPWREPELLRELIRLPWPDRGPLARLLRAVRGRVARRPGAAAVASAVAGHAQAVLPLASPGVAGSASA